MKSIANLWKLRDEIVDSVEEGLIQPEDEFLVEYDECMDQMRGKAKVAIRRVHNKLRNRAIYCC